MRPLRTIASLTAVASAAAGASVPKPPEVIAALQATCPGIKAISKVRCADFAPDEPTEAECKYTVQVRGRLITDKTYFAIDRDGWLTIDTPRYCPKSK